MSEHGPSLTYVRIVLPPYRLTAKASSKSDVSENGGDNIRGLPKGSAQDLSLQLLSNSQAPGTDHWHPIAGEEAMESQYHREGTSTEYHLGDGMNYRSVRDRSVSPMQPATETTDWLSPEPGPPSRSWTFPQESPFP